MSLESTITKAWNKQAKWLYLLLPISWLYGVITKTRKVLYNKGTFNSYKADVPVMVVGNITVGGSGKTPLIISLVKYLQRKNIKVAVISRGYGGNVDTMPSLVTLESTPNMVGDEPCLIVQSTLFYGVSIHPNPVPMAVCPNRQQAIECLLEAHPEIDLIISDDGLQHYKLQRDIEWVVVDSKRGFGNGQLLPTGFLREPVSRLNNTTVIYHQPPNCITDDESTLSMSLIPSAIEPLLHGVKNPQPLQETDTVIAMTGIGYPTRFFSTLKNIGFTVVENPLSDHHKYTLDDIYQFVNHSMPIVVTSKDAVKLRELANNDLYEWDEEAIAHLAEVFTRIWVLPVTAKLSDACYQSIDDSLNKLNIKPKPLI